MEHGLTMEPNDRDFGAIDAMLLAQAFDRLRLRLGHQAFGFGEGSWAPRAVGQRKASASVRCNRSRSGPG